jgi:hypothetical protein
MSQLTEKRIGELLSKKFLVPSYQRGYRWEENQVKDLLDDIWSFIEKPSKKDHEWYCLQPIVVKKQGEQFELLDGQQRLTTIFLILKHLERFIESDVKNFELDFKTRNNDVTNSKEFLRIIEVKSLDEANENIDYFHIYKAYTTIVEWFREKANNGYISISSKFATPFLESTKVIWYEIDVNQDEIEIFTRLNMGKIPLTNAELIKALFLNISNYSELDPKEIKLVQLEIATEWDRIEYALQNNELWYFITNNKFEFATRIELIFRLVALMDDDLNRNDDYATFRYFSEKFKNRSVKEIEFNWGQIKRVFQTIEEWFNDRELYHKIGFLIATSENLNDLLRIGQGKRKGEFKSILNVKIIEKSKCDSIENLKYGQSVTKNVLLLHNIQTMLNNEDETSRFPFDRYVTENWDIEHIHAIATKVSVKRENQISWLKQNYTPTQVHLQFDTHQKIQEAIDKNIEFLESDFQAIIEFVLGDDDNSIRNLCLLDRATNRSYKNDSFKQKRFKIIENEKKGTFIPICTKNVFMKYYSNEVGDLEIWNEKDRDSYLADIVNVLNQLKNSNK